MTRTLAPLRAWFDGRTSRERRLLLVMFVLAGLTMAWLGVVRPVFAWRDASAARLDLAETRLSAVRRVQTEAPAATPVRGPTSQNIEPTVKAAAAARGVPVVLAMDQDGRLGFRVARVRTGEVLGWLAGLEAASGVRVCSLSLVENADATVNAEGGLAAGACDVAGAP